MTSAANGGTCQSVALRGDDVEVSVQQESGQGGIGAGDPRDDTLALAGRGAEALGVESHLAQGAFDVFSRQGFARSGIGAVVGGVDADEVAQDLDDLVLGSDGIG